MTRFVVTRFVKTRFFKTTQNICLLCALLICALFTVDASTAIAQSSGGQFTITRSTIDNGGGVSVGGQFVVTGTIGQSDASVQTASGGSFDLSGGFWTRGVAVPLEELIFSDGFEDL